MAIIEDPQPLRRQRTSPSTPPALLLPVLLPLLLWPLAACDAAAGRGAASGAAADAFASASSAATAAVAWSEPLPDSVFGALVEELSEPGGYFDTDNLISNEASYLHAVSDLRQVGVSGGTYIGVGPAQNFSYLAHIRPAVAFIIDIRRDNLLQHLWYKALFELAETRLDYLCLLTLRACGSAAAVVDGREPRSPRGIERELDAAGLVDRVDRAVRLTDLEEALDRVADRAGSHGVPVSPEDLEVIRSIHRRFAEAGLDLRFNTHGRAPQPYYPTLRQLILERDRAGDRVGYLAREELFATARTLQRANRVIPVVGDLAGEHALKGIGRAAEDMGQPVTAFYTSNVEFYLVRGGTVDRYLETLSGLPLDSNAVIIRSYFNRFRSVPQSEPGYASTQIVQPIAALLSAWREGEIRGYLDLVTTASVGR